MYSSDFLPFLGAAAAGGALAAAALRACCVRARSFFARVLFWISANNIAVQKSKF